MYKQYTKKNFKKTAEPSKEKNFVIYYYKATK